MKKKKGFPASDEHCGNNWSFNASRVDGGLKDARAFRDPKSAIIRSRRVVDQYQEYSPLCSGL